MERIEGLAIDLGLETTALSRGLTGLKDKLKTVNSEMKANLSAFDRGDQSIAKYEATLTGLNRKLNLQQAIVDETRKEYERLSAEFGQGSKEAEKAAREYNHQVANLNNLQRSVERTSSQLEEMQRTQASSSTAWGKFRQSMDKTGESLTNVGEKMQGIGGTLTTGLTAPLAAVGILAGKTAMEFDSAQGKIQAQLGLTQEKAASLGKIAQNVWSQGFGESVGEVADSIAVINQRMGDLSGDELQGVTKAAFTLSEAFGADVADSTRAAAQLMQQFGLSGTDAMDMIAAAFQRGGDYSGELLDSISEYSTQFKNMGFSSEQMMGIFVSGAENGIFSLDKLADATKESFLQITDGADNTRTAISSLGLDYDQISSDLQSGGMKANAAFGVVMTALAGVEDGAKRNALAIELMGTPIEDLGPQYQTFFSQTDTQLKDFKGAAKNAADALQGNLGERAQKVWRGFLKDMEPVGETLVGLAEDVLPKVADVVENVTGAFNDLSPGAQKTALAVGGIAAAAGPTLTAIGFMSQGLGSLAKFLGPTVEALGGKGLLGILGKIPGPIGLIVTGLGLAVGGFSLYNKAVEESKKVNLDQASSLAEQSAKLSDLTGKYDALRDKNKLSNDELLRFRDINSELKLATSADEISKLKDEQAKLQEKSGLTNDELSTMFKLNDDLISQAPTIDQTYSDRGNAIINNRDGLKQANDEMREQLRLELENQRVKADANLDKAIQDQITALQELGAKDAELDQARSERDAQRLAVKQAERNLDDARTSGDQARVTIAENELLLEQGKLNGLNTEVSTRADIVGQKQEAVNKAQEEITKTQELYNKLIDLQLAQAGINTKGDEGIKQLDQAILKNQSRITELKNARDSQGGLNQAQQTELSTLEKTLGTQQTSRTEISRIKGEQDGVNQKVAEGKKHAENMTKELSKDTKKNVKIDDHGDTEEINKKAAKPVTKTITISALIKGLTSKMKDFFGFEKGTQNAPGGLSLVGESGPELLYIPRGSKVIPNNDTKKILQNWKIPGFQTGGIVSRPGVYKLAEDGFSEFIIPTNPSRRSEASKLLALAARTIDQQSGTRTMAATAATATFEPPQPRQPVMIQLVTPDKREFAKWMIDDISELQKLNTSRINLFERK